MRAGAVGLRGRTLFSTFVTLSYGPLLPLNLWLNFENLTHCPFKKPDGNNYDILKLKKKNKVRYKTIQRINRCFENRQKDARKWADERADKVIFRGRFVPEN